MKARIFPVLLIALLVLFSGCVQPDGNGLGPEDVGGIKGNNEGNGTIEPGNGNGGSNMAEKVESGDKVAVEYKGTLSDGTQFDASEGRGPLEFTAGAGQMIKGFDKAVIGMALNQEKTVTMKASDAYGEADPSKVVEVPKENISGSEDLEVGMSITSSSGVNGIIQEIKEDTLVIDFNHKLAGKDLTFWIKVVKIEK